MGVGMRVTFLIDGFNVYHSAKDVLRLDNTDPPIKWLDIPALCQTIVRDCALPREAEINKIHYFSALATHLAAKNPGVVARHETFISALEHFGVQVHLGKFKWAGSGYEEKETDVAIGAMLLEVFHTDSADVTFIMSGDTDLMPAVATCRRLFPDKKICFAFPYRRMNNILKDTADHHFTIRAHQYPKHQFPNPIKRDGDAPDITCPSPWL